MVDRHEFMLEIDEGCVQLVVRCPYDRADPCRPCWPMHEDGNGDFTQPDPPPQQMCTYEDWVGNTALGDIVWGQAKLPLAVDIEWRGGNMEVHLRGQEG